MMFKEVVHIGTIATQIILFIIAMIVISIFITQRDISTQAQIFSNILMIVLLATQLYIANVLIRIYEALTERGGRR